MSIIPTDKITKLIFHVKSGKTIWHIANKVITFLKPEEKAAKMINADIVYRFAFLLQASGNKPINNTLLCSLQYLIFNILQLIALLI